MDLLNISYTEESFVLTQGECHLPCMRIRYGQYSDYVLLFQDVHDLTSWPCA